MIKLPKLRPGDVVLVKWLDICDSVSWESSLDKSRVELMLIATVGIFIKFDKSCNHKVIRLAHSVAEDGDRDCVVIPTVLLEKIEILKRKK